MLCTICYNATEKPKQCNVCMKYLSRTCYSDSQLHHISDQNSHLRCEECHTCATCHCSVRDRQTVVPLGPARSCARTSALLGHVLCSSPMGSRCSWLSDRRCRCGPVATTARAGVQRFPSHRHTTAPCHRAHPSGFAPSSQRLVTYTKRTGRS